MIKSIDGLVNEMMARNTDNSHINERRLRPIYDCLDNGNNKKALQEAEKVLKKQKDLLCAKVLKGLALLRMGRHEESLSILNEVHKDSPTDDSTLQAMTICYRELHKIELIADAYEMAIKKDPNNEELHSHLFMAFVRMSDYKKQQLTALSLYKLKPKNPYYFWAVMSIFMQAMSAKDENIAQKVTLPLAEKMCQKFFDERKIEAEAEVELYLMILEKQKKYKQMLNIIESPIGTKLSTYLDFLSRRKAELLKLQSRYREAFDAYKVLIENNVDQIEYYLELFNISNILDENELIVKNDLIIEENHDSHHYLSSVLELIEKCIEKGNHNPMKNSTIKPFQRQRGPYLAKMVFFELLIKRQQTQGDVEQLLKQINSSITDLLFEYYKDFGSKHACIYDMCYILDKTFLNKEETDCLILQMKQFVMNISEVNNDLNAMQQHMCFYYISHYMGQHDNITEEQRLALVKYLLEKYETYYQNIVINSDLTQTEPQPTDPYIILLSNILLVEKSKLEDNFVFQLIVTNEWALTRSPSNFYFKLLLIKLYNSWGAVGASHTLLDSLDIKHIQHDSLGYIYTTPFIVCGHLSTSSQLLGNALKFYSANFKDTLDYLISCYKYGSFTKVEEIINLRNKLNNSLQFCLASVERMILDLILETKNHSATETIINYMEIDPEKDKFVWNDLCDNRDFSVIQSNHQKTEALIKDKQTKTFEDELLWLKIRNLIIRAIAAAHHSVSNNVQKKEIQNNNNIKTSENNETNGIEKRSFIDILKELSLKFREYINSLNCSTFSQSILPVQGPHPSRITSFSKTNHFEVLLALFEFIISLQNEPKEKDSFSSVKCGDIFTSIISEVELIVSNNKNLYSMGSTFEELTNSIETLSIAIILIGIIQSIMKKKMNISIKKNRRKKDNTRNDLPNDSLMNVYNSLVIKFEESALHLQKIIKSINISDSIFSQTFSLFDLSESDSIATSVKVKVEQSYNQSIKELSELLQNKIIYLQTLKF